MVMSIWNHESMDFYVSFIILEKYARNSKNIFLNEWFCQQRPLDMVAPKTNAFIDDLGNLSMLRSLTSHHWSQRYLLYLAIYNSPRFLTVYPQARVTHSPGVCVARAFSTHNPSSFCEVLSWQMGNSTLEMQN